MDRIFKHVSTFSAVLLWPTVAAAQPVTDRDFWWGSGWGWGHMMFGGVMMFAFWGAIILLVVLAVRWMTMSETFGRREARRATPLEILQERFARGDIDKDEYEERRRTLER